MTLPVTAETLRNLPSSEVDRILRELGPEKSEELKYTWPFWARPEQLEPTPKNSWNTWLALAGRGWGKTRAGAEWVRHRIKSGDKIVHCVAPTKGDVRRVMVEGESGLLNVCWKGDKTYRGKHIGFPEWSPTNNTMTWANGAKAVFFSAEDPERLRGPQAYSAWCDEICLVAGSMITTAEGDKPIESITANDTVLTRYGYKPVVSAWHTGKRSTWKVTTRDGRTLQGTQNHPVMTEAGWKNLSELKVGENILVLNGEVAAGIKPNTTTSTEVASPSTEKSIKSTTDQSPRDTIYTTSTRTKRTTVLKTSWLFLFRITSSLTSLEVLRETILTPVSALKRCGKTASLVRLLAMSVERSSFQRAQEQNFVPQIVSLDTITSVEQAEESDVYNLEVEYYHEYFANGILNHNCAWRNAQETWDMMQFGLRLGRHPQVFVTTTPKTTKLLRSIINDPKTVISKGSTYDNASNLAGTFLDAIKSTYEGTRLGRQELYAEVLDEAADALWSRELLAKCEIEKDKVPELARIVVALDPAVTAGTDSDLTGIIVAGVDINGYGYVLADHTDKYTPQQWANKAISLYEEYEADRIVAEVNQGGDLVKHTIHTEDPTVPIRMVRASRSKKARAEPVSALYEQGKVFHVRGLNDLEDQLVQYEPLGSLGSPDRLDAMVWALTDLMLNGFAKPQLQLVYSNSKGLR